MNTLKLHNLTRKLVSTLHCIHVCSGGGWGERGAENTPVNTVHADYLENTQKYARTYAVFSPTLLSRVGHPP